MRVLCAGSLHRTRLANGVGVYRVSAGAATLTMAYIVFWVGKRSWFADTTAYVSSFVATVPDVTQLPALLVAEGKGVLWQASIVLFKAYISDDWQTWLMSLAMVMGFSVSYCHYKHSEAFFFSMLIFVLMTDFTWMMNGMRQFLCVSSLMVALKWLIEGKTKHYLILIAVLSLVHFTVWIMAPIYFVVRQKPWSKLVLLAIFGTCCLCALAAPFSSTVEEVLQNTQYSGAKIMNEFDDGAHPLRALFFAVPPILAWYNRKRIEQENNSKLNILINLSLLSALLMLFAVFTSGIMMGRLAIYCSVYSALTLPMVISRWTISSRNLIKLSCLVGYAAYYYCQMNGVPYSSYLTGYIP